MNGILVPPGDIAALRNAINELVNNEQLRTRISQNAASINESNDFNRLAGEYEKFIFS